MDDHDGKRPAGGEDSTPAESGADELVELMSVQGEIEASVIKSLLESEGIVPLAKSGIVQSIYPFSVDGLGKVTIWVRRADRDRSNEIIAEYKGRE